MINKIEFKSKNLTSNAGLFLMLENTKNNGIFEMIESDLNFESASINKIKMNHIKTMLCGHFIGIDKLERLKLIKNDPLVREFEISVKEPENRVALFKQLQLQNNSNVQRYKFQSV